MVSRRLNAKRVLDLVEETSLCGLMGNFVAERFAELFENRPLLCAELLRCHHMDGHDLIAAIATAHIGNALVSEPELLARLRSGR